MQNNGIYDRIDICMHKRVAKACLCQYGFVIMVYEG